MVKAPIERLEGFTVATPGGPLLLRCYPLGLTPQTEGGQSEHPFRELVHHLAHVELPSIMHQDYFFQRQTQNDLQII